MFGTVQPTPYDFQFRLLGIPVRVSIWFWLAGVILGYNALDSGFEFLLGWLVVLFVSILVHELGHALVARKFGYPPSILLYHFGGLAFYQPGRDLTAGRSIAISLAGPGAGFILFLLTLAWAQFIHPQIANGVPDRTRELMADIVYQMMFINLIWGLVNLLPVLPLDGGRVCQAICLVWSPARGSEWAMKIGIVFAGLAAAFFFTAHMQFAAMMFAILCANNVMALQQPRQW